MPETEVREQPQPKAASRVKKSDPAPSPPESPEPSLFARRLSRLEQISILLRHAYRDHARCLEAEKRQKATLYLTSEARSHGEREGYASANAVDLSAETLIVKAEISALEEERDFIKFCIEYDAGE
ncbi:MAG: hypothetical protein ACLGH3_04755 [Actinomycetota bacterium]